MRQIHLLSLLFFLAIIFGCTEEEAIKEINNPEVYLEKIEPPVFQIGDTVKLIGKNFGNERKNKYVEFYGWEIDENKGYLEWTDTLITVIVPTINGDEDINNGTAHINERLSNGVKYKVDRGTFINVINWLVFLSIFLTFIYLYLKINKIWKRKHLQEVAEAQSLSGMFLLIVNCMLWVAYYIFVNYDTKGWIDQAIYVVEGAVFFIIGTGIFVKGQKKFGFWNLIVKALKLERKEADYLLKKFFKPLHAEVILHILHQVAMIDEEFDPKEQEIIQLFAKDWSIEYDFEKLEMERKQSADNRFERLRKIVNNYLESEPPEEQVAQLKDMIGTMIQADEKVSEEEALISSEIIPMLENYLNKGKKAVLYDVIIVPQEKPHELIVHELFPNTERFMTAGGYAYAIGSYYSPKFAEMMCEKYRNMNLFTIVYCEGKPYLKE
jgi:energy-coupling factor transporter transmembrane protein EcfT